MSLHDKTQFFGTIDNVVVIQKPQDDCSQALITQTYDVTENLSYTPNGVGQTIIPNYKPV